MFLIFLAGGAESFSAIKSKGLVPLAGRSTTALGRNIDRIERNIESIESKIAKIFKRPKNREDGSDFDDFWTESIVSTQSIFSKIFERTKNNRIDRID